MEPYSPQGRGFFAAGYLVKTAHEIFSWTETHPVTPDATWHDATWYAGGPDMDRFVCAVPTPTGLVAFFAPTPADAARIRLSVF